MQRLLMGEVGSGKTVVALYAMLRAVEHGAQAALMAPTETLAEQHFATLQSLLPDAFTSAALLTGATPAGRRTDLLNKLSSGELQLLVGTHALIEDAVEFDRLAVVVVDEQHRFGVNQRRALDRKGPGDLAPARAAHDRDADPAHARAHRLRRPRRDGAPRTAAGPPPDHDPRRQHGRRARPRLRPHRARSSTPGARPSSSARSSRSPRRSQARAATAEYERLKSTEFKDYRVVLLHGRMTPREKQEAMLSFAAREADVLVATTVIEVGIDVPNASVMIVEDAERYGISQLHQLRGRVGRGPHESLCLLFGPKESARLRALEQYRDGFKLAEIDLELRGEGELIGVRQSGLAAFRFARLPEDAEELDARARPRARPARRGRAAARDRARRGVRRRGARADPGMRVIAGAYKGPAPPRTARAPPRVPTSDRVREALFSILGAPRRRTPTCWTCSPARARSASRPSRAAHDGHVRRQRSRRRRLPYAGISRASRAPRSHRRDARAFLREARATGASIRSRLPRSAIPAGRLARPGAGGGTARRGRTRRDGDLRERPPGSAGPSRPPATNAATATP